MVPNRRQGVSFLLEQDWEGLSKVGERFSHEEQWENSSGVKTNIKQSILCLDGRGFPPCSFVAVARHTLGEKCERESTCTVHREAAVNNGTRPHLGIHADIWDCDLNPVV